MSKNGSTFPIAGNDFYKTNGTTHVVMPGGPSLTRQEFAEECDINTLMKRYEAVGSGPGGLPRPPDFPPMYADFSTMPTNLLEYMQLMSDAEQAFMMLPAGVRREFDNSPFAFVDFASDPKNLDQMRAWGLAPPAKAPEGPPAGTPAPVPGGPGTAAPAAPPAAGAASTHSST